MTQCERIIDYMQRFGSITTAEAFNDLECTRLASRINDIKRGGVKINSEFVSAVNRFGKRLVTRNTGLKRIRMALVAEKKYRIPGYSSYAIDTNGNVYSRRRKGWYRLIPSVVGGVERKVNIRRDSDGQFRVVTVFYLMKLTFFRNLPKGYVVTHKANFPDDSIGNLKVITEKEWSKRRARANRKRIALYNKGRLIRIYPSIEAYCRTINRPRSTVKYWLSRELTPQGYTLKYVPDNL